MPGEKEKLTKGAEEEKTIAKGIGFCSFGRCSIAEDGRLSNGQRYADT